jgi:hypothetical protein
VTCGQVRDIAMMHSEHTLQRVLLPDSTKPNRQTLKEEDLKVWHADKVEACAAAAGGSGSGSGSSQVESSRAHAQESSPAHAQESSRGEGRRRWGEGKLRAAHLWADLCRQPRAHLCCITGKLRIAYLSADFCNHPTADLMQSALLLHDKDRFGIARVRVEEELRGRGIRGQSVLVVGVDGGRRS